MDAILNKRSFTLATLFILFLLSFLWIKSLTDGLSAHLVFSVTSLQTVEEIIDQVIQENEQSTSGGDQKNKPSLKEEIENAKSRLSKSDYKSAKSNYKRMVEHVEKLEKYKQNPLKFDNQGLLKNAPTEQIRQKIIQTRIAHLEKEIQTFYNNIITIIS